MGQASSSPMHKNSTSQRPTLGSSPIVNMKLVYGKSPIEPLFVQNKREHLIKTKLKEARKSLNARKLSVTRERSKSEPISYKSSFSVEAKAQERTRRNSTGSVWSAKNSSPSSPCMKLVIEALSEAFFWLIQDQSSLEKCAFGHIDKGSIWDDTENPVWSLSLRKPDREELRKVIAIMQKELMLSEETLILALVLCERLLDRTLVKLTEYTWRRILGVCVMTADKVWEDPPVWVGSYNRVFHLSNLHDLKELEREFLKALDWDVSMTPSVYTSYYCALRSVKPRLVSLCTSGPQPLEKVLNRLNCPQQEAKQSHARASITRTRSSRHLLITAAA